MCNTDSGNNERCFGPGLSCQHYSCCLDPPNGRVVGPCQHPVWPPGQAATGLLTCSIGNAAEGACEFSRVCVCVGERVCVRACVRHRLLVLCSSACSQIAGCICSEILLCDSSMWLAMMHCQHCVVCNASTVCFAIDALCASSCQKQLWT